MGPQWLFSSMPTLERAIYPLTFDFHPGGECHLGIYFQVEMFRVFRGYCSLGKPFKQESGGKEGGGRHCKLRLFKALSHELLRALPLKKDLHLFKTQPSLFEDILHNDEEQISHKPLVLLPARP